MIGRLGILLLGAVLLVWTPAGFAAELSATLPTAGMRGPIAVVELLAHGLVAALSAAGGWALWTRRAHGPALARIALVAAAVQTVQSLYWSILPRQTPPGLELPLAAVAVMHAAFWLLFLSRSSRVRTIATGASL